MASQLKTQRNDASVTAFLDSVREEKRRKDCYSVAALMEEVTGEKPAMWGTSIVGFGSYHYKYDSGQEGDWPLVGFSPRKDSLTLYIMPGFADYTELLGRLGKHKKGVSCLYIKSLADVDLATLKTLVRQSVKHMKQRVNRMQESAKERNR